LFLHAPGALLNDLLDHLVTLLVGDQVQQCRPDRFEDLFLLGLRSTVEYLLNLEGSCLILAYFHEVLLHNPPVEDFFFLFDSFQLLIRIQWGLGDH